MNLNRLKQQYKKQNRYIRDLTDVVEEVLDNVEVTKENVLTIKEDVKKLDTKAVSDGR